MAILQNRTCKECGASFVPKWTQQFSCSQCLDEIGINSVKKNILKARWKKKG